MLCFYFVIIKLQLVPFVNVIDYIIIAFKKLSYITLFLTYQYMKTFIFKVKPTSRKIVLLCAPSGHKYCCRVF